MQTTVKSIASAINRFLDVPSLNPDDARRRKLLNVLLFVMAAGGLIIGPIPMIATRFGQEGENIGPSPAAFAMYLGTVVIVFAINRYRSGWLAGLLFLASLHVTIIMSDPFYELANGRSLSAFTIPIVFSSVILQPYASFIAAGIDSLIITFIALRIGITPNPFAMITFFVIAAASWLATRSLERALKDLRTLNLELDQRAEQRTRQLAERTDELAAALAENQAILDSTVDGIIVLDNQNRAMIVNPSAVALLGRPEHEIIGHDIETVMGSDVSDNDKRLIYNLLQGEKMPAPSIQFEWAGKTLLTSVAVVRLDSGREVGSVLVFCDFTREAKIDRMKSAFVSIASHDLRTPLGAILGYAGMLRHGRRGSLTDDQNEIVDGIVSAAEEMRALADNLLDKAQIEAGSFTLHLKPFSPADLVEGVRDVMLPLVEAKGLEFVTRVEEDVPATIMGDRQRLHQILINLVSNAVKFTFQGAITLRTYLQDDAHWTLAVSDTGRGILEEEQGHIFEPFRCGEGTDGQHRGAGLGLYIVKELVELMDGEIHLESQVDRGSTFAIVLPTSPEARQRIKKRTN